MKNATKSPVKKNVKKIVKKNVAAKKSPSPVKKVTIRNASELTNFIGKALPWMRDTNKAKHLRKIEVDEKSKGKAVIIWYGCESMSAVTKLQVTVNLKVHKVGFLADPSVIRNTENELKIAFACMYAKPVVQEKTEVEEKIEKVEEKVEAEPVMSV